MDRSSVIDALDGAIGCNLRASQRLDRLPKIFEVDDKIPSEYTLRLRVELHGRVHKPLVHSANVDDGLDGTIGVLDVVVNTPNVLSGTDRMGIVDFQKARITRWRRRAPKVVGKATITHDKSGVLNGETTG